LIQNKKLLRALVREWEGVRLTLALVKSNMNGALSSGGSTRFTDLSYSLVLPFAFSVLQQVLVELRDEGIFACDSGLLEPLMHCSRTSLPWMDYRTIRIGSEVSNDFVRNQKIPSTAMTWKYIDAIEAELVAWNIFPATRVLKHRIDFGAFVREAN
jgi:hypothetical protein